MIQIKTETMAENKKAFILYADLIHTVLKMPDDKAGLLFKHILRHENGENPVTDDLIVDLTFEPIKQQLKRDAEKYNQKRKQRSEAGKRSAEVRRVNKTQRPLTTVDDRSTTVDSVPTNLTVTVTDTVTDTDTVKDNNNKKTSKKIPRFNFRGELLKFGVDEKVLDDWLLVRKQKKAVNSETALRGFLNSVGKSGLSIPEAVLKCAENGWKGFNKAWLDNQNGLNKPQSLQKRIDEALPDEKINELKRQEMEYLKTLN